MDSSLKDPNIFFDRLASLSDEELLSFLIEWHQEGEKPEEIKAFVEYIYAQKPAIDTGFACFDCAGTGGDKADTFNISTCAAIVAAACGVKVTKHGGRSTTSTTGSVDVLEALGVDLGMRFEAQLEALKKYNLAFFSSKVTGSLLGRIKQLCRKHKTTSFISMLGPLTNPVRLSGQILGCGQARWMETVADALLSLASKSDSGFASSLKDSGSVEFGSKAAHYHALVVHSHNQAQDSNDFRLDEISAVSPTEIIEIAVGDNQKGQKIYHSFCPEDIGLKTGRIEELVGGSDSQSNAQIILDILDSKISGTKLNAVCLNAAALVYLATAKQGIDLPSNKAQSRDFFVQGMKNAFEQCYESIKNGQVKANFEGFLSAQLC